MARKAKPDEQKKPRTRKAKEQPVTEEAVQQPVAAPEPVVIVVPPQAQQPEPIQPAAQEPELQGAKPRKSGRRAWEINLKGPGQTWERVETPDQLIVFRFLDEPNDAQHALIEKYGFAYENEHKEAHRPNDATGRVYADKLAFWLKDLERGESQGRAAG